MSAGKDSPHTRLDQPDDGSHIPGAGGSADLASSHAAKKKAAGYLETHLAPDTKTAFAHADTDTASVTGAVPGPSGPLSPSARPSPTDAPSLMAGPFQGWALRTGLSNAHTAWEQQVKNLLARLASERDALRGANNTIHGNDGDTGRDIERTEARVWAKLHRLVLDELGTGGELDWSRCAIDSVSVHVLTGGG